MIYIYIKQSVALEPNTEVAVRDIAQLSGAGASAKSVKDVVLGKLENSPVLFTAVDVAAALGRDDISFVGSPSCAVLPRPAKAKPLVRFVKTALVALLLFVGGGMTVIAYQTDTDMPEAHKALARIFTGDESNTAWVEIPYCIGVGLGVLFFANVTPWKKRGPTIFEMEEYEKESEKIEYMTSKAEEQK